MPTRPITKAAQLFSLFVWHVPCNTTKECGRVGMGAQHALDCPRCPQRGDAEAARPAKKWLNFILNSTQHPGSMKWKLIIKLKSLSAEQLK